MVDSISISLSGLRAQSQKLGTTANNIANVSTVGIVPEEGNTSTVYQGQAIDFRSIQVDGEAAGVLAEAREDAYGYSVTYAPDSPYANVDGNIAVPNVDLTTEAVDLMTTELAYKANIAALKTADEMERALLDTLA